MARYGGEEFVVILEGASRDEAIGIAEQVRAAFAKQSVDTGTGQRLNSTVSAGCSTLDPWEIEGTLLLERADVALAMSKAGGGDQVVAASRRAPQSDFRQICCPCKLVTRYSTNLHAPPTCQAVGNSPSVAPRSCGPYR
jgi:predicted signal transduction protein with EAL and GGDEF domain